jgi:uncharacterized protein (DUF58 family)
MSRPLAGVLAPETAAAREPPLFRGRRRDDTTWWQRFWAQAPRQLRFTRAGQVLVFIAFATGFAALNTGNNLLFLSWGLVLATIVLSGILSEGTLRSLMVQGEVPASPRAGEVAMLRLTLQNEARRLPAYAVEVEARVRGTRGDVVARAPFQLKLAGKEKRDLFARFVAPARGRHEVGVFTARTAYPFGFFEKSRRFALAPAVFFVMPRRVEVGHLRRELSTQAGEAIAPRVGSGDEFFGLRPYRPGDDLRRVHFRRSAKTGRLVTREQHARTGRIVMLELRLDFAAPVGSVELAIAQAGSLAEQLLEEGFAVGMLGPGFCVAPGGSAAHGWEILGALARLEGDVAVPPLPHQLAQSRVVLSMKGGASGASVLVVGSSEAMA